MSKAKVKLETTFAKAEESPGFLLWKAANLLQRSHIQVLRPLNITPAQFSMMTCLVYLAQEGGVTSARISRHAGLDKMMISDLVKTLIRKKWISTRANPADGRSFLIEPTELGVKLTNQAVRHIEETDDKFFSCEKNRAGLAKSLLNLIQHNGGPE